MNQYYRIYWRSALTGKTGHGQAKYTKDHAEEIAKKMNKGYKGTVIHWCEPVQE